MDIDCTVKSRPLLTTSKTKSGHHRVTSTNKMKLQMNVKLSCLASLAAFAAFAGVNSAHATVIDLGSSLRPAGANYTIYAVQDINAANPTGVMNVGPGLFINQNVEYTGALGVTYTVGSGSVSKEPGMNLYNNGLTAGIQSTGLLYKFDTGIAASTAGVTLLDFDMKAPTAYGSTAKAQPQVTLFSTSGAIIATIDPQTILHNSVFTKDNDGSLTINMGTLLNALGLPDQTIGSYIISAADYAGASLQQFRTADDPFFVGPATGGIPSVPEPSSFLPLLGVLGMVIAGPKLRRKFVVTES